VHGVLGRGFEAFILILLLVVLAGARRVPEALRNARRAARVLRSEARAARDGVPLPEKRVIDAEPGSVVWRDSDGSAR
jgi:Sec-independent protein translocase protein TatA